MEPINTQSTIILLTDALNKWIRVPRDGSVVLYKNGQFKSVHGLNAQPRWQLFENISRLLASGNWFSQEVLSYPLCETSLISSLSRLNDIVATLWHKSLKTKRTLRTYEMLQTDIKVVSIWLREVSDIGKIIWNLNEENLGTYSMRKVEIQDAVETLKNLNLCTLHTGLSAFNDKLHSIRTQALDYAHKMFVEHLAKGPLTETVSLAVDGGSEIKYTVVKQIFPEKILGDTKEELRRIVDRWKGSLERSREDVNEERCERLILQDQNNHIHNFTKFNFGADHELLFPETFSKKFYNTIDEVFPSDATKRLVLLSRSIIQVAIEYFAQEQKLIGKHRLRIQLKAFFYQVATPSSEPKTYKFNLKWHYDYCGKVSLVIPLMNEFTNDTPGDIMFARNGYEGKCSGYKGSNVSQAIPLEKTIIKVPYPKDGGLMFEGMRGAQIHSPSPITILAGKTGIFAKVLLQIVLYDNEWMSRK